MTLLFMKIASWIPVSITIGVVTFCYSIYMGTYLIPKLIGVTLFTKSQTIVDSVFLQAATDLDTMFFGGVQRNYLLLFIIIHLLLLMFCVSLYRTIVTKAGQVPKHWKQEIQREIDEYLKRETNAVLQWQIQKRNEREIVEGKDKIVEGKDKVLVTSHGEDDESEVDFNDAEQREEALDVAMKLRLNIQAKMELLDKRGRRFCKRCQSMKPSRTHHCSQCQECQLKMDHHCQFVNNCIGFCNYKFFMNLLVYASAMLVLMVITYASTFSDAMGDQSVGDWMLLLVVLFYEFVITLALLLVCFTLFHFLYFIITSYKKSYHQQYDYPRVSGEQGRRTERRLQ